MSTLIIAKARIKAPTKGARDADIQWDAEKGLRNSEQRATQVAALAAVYGAVFWLLLTTLP